MAETVMESTVMNVLEKINEVAGIFAPAGVEPVIYWLVFFLVFTIVYNALIMTKGFQPDAQTGKDPRKGMRVVISLVIAYFASMSPRVIDTVYQTFPEIAVLLIGAVAFMFTTFFIFGESAANFLQAGIIKLLVFGSMILIFWTAFTGTALPEIFQRTESGIVIWGIFLSDYDIALLILIGGFIWFMSWILKSESSSSGSSSKVGRDILNWLLGQKGGSP